MGDELVRRDPLDDRMSMRRAQDVPPQRPGRGDVGKVAAAAGQEAVILEAPDGTADIGAHREFLAHSRDAVTLPA